jgi:hypothetical protein
LLYEALFRINRLRHHRGDTGMRNFLRAHGAESAGARIVEGRVGAALRVPQRA